MVIPRRMWEAWREEDSKREKKAGRGRVGDEEKCGGKEQGICTKGRNTDQKTEGMSKVRY